MHKIALDLRLNALHTLHHAIEHLYSSQLDPDAKLGRVYDHGDHMVSWRDEAGHLCFPLSEFTPLPPVYNLKFAMLHLIQAAELLLKCYVAQCEPTALFVKSGSRRTIDLRTALIFTVERNPTLLSPAQYALLLEAKEFRNLIEHYQFTFEHHRILTLCTDFLAICALFCQALLALNIVEAFSYDYLHDRPDAVAEYLASLLGEASESGLCAARKTGGLWASRNADQPVFLCLTCGAPTVSKARGVCMGCGSEGDEELVTLLQDFETAVRRVAELQDIQKRRKKEKGEV